jgi:SAM-dependent methyltransferase
MPACFYDTLAEWWLLFSPPSEYGEEAADLLQRLGPRKPGATLLELGSGGGSLASHLKPYFEMTLTDLSPGMLAVNRQVNPECEHMVGDMKSLRLGRQFDVVLVHDAVMYATDLRTAAIHCKPGGTVAVLPDFVRETYQPSTDEGGHDGSDGRGFRYLEWSWDPDPTDDTYTVDYAFLLREPSGEVRVLHDRHIEGLFPRARWLEWFRAVGLSATSSLDAWGRDVFLATPIAEHT